MLTGAYAMYFQNFSLRKQKQLIESDPNFKKLIICLYNQGDKINPSTLKKVFTMYKTHGINYTKQEIHKWGQEENETETMKAISESSVLMKDAKQAQAWKIYQHTYTQIAITIVDLALVLIPIMKLDFKPVGSVLENQIYWQSELMSSYIFVEALFIYFVKKERLTDFVFLVRLVGAIVTFVSGNFLEFYPQRLDNTELYTDSIVFKIWAFSC